MKKCKGFTLLEMIVVVMIISILFLLTVPNVSKIMNSVESVGCDALLKVVDGYDADIGYDSSLSSKIKRHQL